MSNKIIPAEQVDKLLTAAKKHGINVDELLSSIGVEIHENANPDQPERTLRADQYCTLLQKVSYRSRGHWFGLPGTESEPYAGFRMLCLAIANSLSLRTAIIRSSEFYQLYGLPDWRFSMLERSSATAIRFLTGDQNKAPSFKTLHYMYILQCFWAWLSGQYSAVKRVNLIGAPSCDISRYQKIFAHCEILFNQSENSLVFDSDYLDAKIMRSEHSLMKFVETSPYQLLTLPEKSDESVTEQIRFLMGSDFTRELPAFDEIIEMLHTSPSTLRRNLKKEGTTFQKIKDEVRKEAAIEYLKQPDINVTCSAIMMGFDDPSAFSRSFKRWTGMAPQHFRAVFFSQSASGKIN